jgi:hypothetical protein
MQSEGWNGKNAGRNEQTGGAGQLVGAVFLINYFSVGREVAMLRKEERKARLEEVVRSRNPPA